MSLILRDLSVRRGGQEVIARTTLPPYERGSFTVIAGPNAAGKSTLLRAIAGLLPASGQIAFDGADLMRMGRGARASVVGFLPQSPGGVSGLTVYESVLAAMHAGGAVFPKSHVAERAGALLARFGVADLAQRPMGALSGGQRQAVGLALAVARDPAVVLLDEPTSALDLGRAFDILSQAQALAREGRVVIAVLHDLAQAAQWADRIDLMDQGRLIASGVPDAVLTPDNLATIYGVRARVERCPQGRMVILVDERITS